MAAPHHHHHRRHHRSRRLLTWDAALVPEGGAAVYRQATALSRTYGKDPAGHIFQLVALKQAGLWGASVCCAVLCAYGGGRGRAVAVAVVLPPHVPQQAQSVNANANAVPQRRPFTLHPPAAHSYSQYCAAAAAAALCCAVLCAE